MEILGMMGGIALIVITRSIIPRMSLDKLVLPTLTSWRRSKTTSGVVDSRYTTLLSWEPDAPGRFAGQKNEKGTTAEICGGNCM